MKTLIRLINMVVLWLPTLCWAQYNQHYAALTQQADSLFREGAFQAASHTFGEALQLHDYVQGVHLYNGACAAALAGDIETAFARLYTRLDLEKDWYSENMSNDDDLASLHDDERWTALTDSMMVRKHRIEANFDKPLRRRLLLIYKNDQEVRWKYISARDRQPHDSLAEAQALQEMQRVDKINQEQICKILDTRGWVGSDKVGNAVSTYWAVIQHADLAIQKKYFPLFQDAALQGDISKESLAMMEDRINMFEGKPQRYGSQIVDNAQGERVVYQLLDASKVDVWRSELGMESLDIYLKRMNAHR